MRHNRVHIEIAIVLFGIMLFLAILNNAITSTVAAQVSSSVTVQGALPSSSSSPQKSPSVRITSPNRGQQVPVGKDLTVSGTSIDNANSDDCKVSVRVNKISPYQQVTAAGTGGAVSKDYSKWKFVLTSKYTTIKPGQNRITAKYECAGNPALTAFSSVNVNGVPAATAATGAPTSTTTTSETAKTNPAAPSTLSLAPNIKELLVSTNLAKDYISRGDTQFVTITVSNSTSNKKIIGADVNANIHNANGLIKTDYTGTTDSSGQASFSLIITPKAKPGLYAIEVNATASGYDPKSNTRVFEVNQ